MTLDPGFRRGDGLRLGLGVFVVIPAKAGIQVSHVVSKMRPLIRAVKIMPKMIRVLKNSLDYFSVV
jgi:hypothetical protein